MQIRENYTVLDREGLRKLSSLLCSKRSIIALDTETYYDEDYKITPQGRPVISRYINGRPQNRPFCLTLYDCDTEQGYYIMEEDLPETADICGSASIDKIFHNLNYDMHMMLNIDVELKEPLHDTMALAQLTNEERMCRLPSGKEKKSKRLKDLGYHFLNENAHEFEDGVAQIRKLIASDRGVAKDDVSFKDAMEKDFELMVNYATYDTELTGRLFPILYKDLELQDLLNPYRIDMRAIVSGVTVERNGMKVDIEKALKWKEEITAVITQLQDKVYDYVGGNTEFNYNSAEELVFAYETLYDLKWSHFTDKGEYSTTAQVLKQFYCTTEEMTAFTELILELRTAEKACNTFIEGILHYVQHTGKVHPQFHVVANDFDRGGTKTGRLSSSNPNFQNFPKYPFTIGGVEYEIRELFIADEGRVFVYMDADQQEYRLLGHYGKDEDFMQLVKDGKDIHTGTASLLFKVAYEDVTKELRSKGKTLNFALVYGQGLVEFAAGIGHEFDKDAVKEAQFFLYGKFKAYELPPHKPLHIFPVEKALALVPVDDERLRYCVKEFFSEPVQSALQEAKALKAKYFSQFTGISNFIKQATELAKKRGWVKTWDGRKRHFTNPKDEAYKAPNSIIQGGCGSMLKVKLPEIEAILQGTNSFVCNLVHDEVQFDMDKKELHLLPQLNASLADLPFKVPISWGIEYGYDWGHKFETMEE